ncbi:ribokinase [Thorsellia anophelis]|uniref:Ribokinase n=1 Tax=Thorsellia anophelis DSM 18579 TaxID=1123402 RepID=A0A1I0AFD1_9GAMM|nr:ribokinase [Thorsellia anophelis DSM 18579]
MKKKLVVLGSINVDHIIHLKTLPKPGETLMGEEYLLAYGGKGANQAVAAGRFNANVSFLGAVGQDTIGQEILKQFIKDGIDTQWIKMVETKNTGVAMIFVDEQAENVIAIYPGANTEVDEQYIESCRSVLESANYLLMQLEIPLDAIIKAASVAKQNHAKVILNPAPARYLPPALLSNIDIITPNETEAFVLTGVEVIDETSAAAASSVLHEYGIETVLITLGSRGVWQSVNKIGRLVPAFKVKAIDTIAAGDTFNGVFVTELLNDKTPEQAIITAHAAAALTVMRKGAQPAIPWKYEIEQFLNEQCV